MPWVLEWTARGAKRSYTLPHPTGKVYLGRPTQEELEKIPLSERRWHGIYIIPVSPKGSPVYTYLDDDPQMPIISRNHALIIVENDTITVKDHGPHGTGSTNGTIVNGQALPPGGESRFTRQTVAIKLTGKGPTLKAKYLVAAEQTVILDEVPGEAREKAGEKPLYLEGVASIVEGSLRRGIMQEEGIRIVIEDPGERENAVQVLSRLKDDMEEVLRKIEKEDTVSVRELAALLDIEIYFKVLNRVESREAERLEKLISLMREGIILPEHVKEEIRVHKTRVDKLIRLLKSNKTNMKY